MITSKEPLIFSSSIFKDDRGFFTQIEHPTVQWHSTNISKSKKDVFRGMHTLKKNPQGKFVRCVQGSIVDFLVDYRPLVSGDKSSPYCHRFTLRSPEEGLWVPPGFLHGFRALEDNTMVLYHVDKPYVQSEDVSVHFKDPSFKFFWTQDQLEMSDKDKNALSWEQFKELSLSL